MSAFVGTLGPYTAPANYASATPNAVFGLGCWSLNFMPPETRVIGMTLPFDNDVTQVEISTNEILSQNKIDAFRGMFVDNSLGADPITFQFSTTLQVIKVPPFAQLWTPIMAPNPQAIQVLSDNAQTLVVHLYNTVIPPCCIVVGDPYPDLGG